MTPYYFVYIWTGRRWKQLKQRFAERILAERAARSMSAYLPETLFSIREEKR